MGHDGASHVDELENAIEHAALLEKTDVLQGHKLPSQIELVVPSRSDSTAHSAPA